MLHVKRTKSGAEHWAAEASPDGGVTRWAAERSAAREFSAYEAGVVAAHYAGRPNAGKVEAVPASGKAPAQAPAKPSRSGGDDDLKAAVEEIYRLQRLLADRDREAAELKSLAGSLRADADRWQRRAEDAARDLEAATAPAATPEPEARANGKPKGGKKATATESVTIPTTEAELATTSG